MKKLLLIIGMQEGFRSPESESIIKNINKAKDYFSKCVIFSKFINQKKYLFEKQLHWKKFQKKTDQLIFPELTPSKCLQITHLTYTVLNKKLKDYIKNNKVKQVYLTGVFTDVCIIKATMDLFDHNIEVFVIKDACASLHGKENHKSSINSLEKIIGKDHIISTKNLI